MIQQALKPFPYCCWLPDCSSTWWAQTSTLRGSEWPPLYLQVWFQVQGLCTLQPTLSGSTYQQSSRLPLLFLSQNWTCIQIHGQATALQWGASRVMHGTRMWLRKLRSLPWAWVDRPGLTPQTTPAIALTQLHSTVVHSASLAVSMRCGSTSTANLLVLRRTEMFIQCVVGSSLKTKWNVHQHHVNYARFCVLLYVV